ncbi:Gti1/Pac2 family-domain-containing protein [Cladochytrium replicatum]|nr:Gti1/Pac2 family-domain-containing protein [Cladochytrium replicatum]
MEEDSSHYQPYRQPAHHSYGPLNFAFPPHQPASAPNLQASVPIVDPFHEYHQSVQQLQQHQQRQLMQQNDQNGSEDIDTFSKFVENLHALQRDNEQHHPPAIPNAPPPAPPPLPRINVPHPASPSDLFALHNLQMTRSPDPLASAPWHPGVALSQQISPHLNVLDAPALHPPPQHHIHHPRTGSLPTRSFNHPESPFPFTNYSTAANIAPIPAPQAAHPPGAHPALSIDVGGLFKLGGLPSPMWTNASGGGHASAGESMQWESSPTTGGMSTSPGALPPPPPSFQFIPPAELPPQPSFTQSNDLPYSPSYLPPPNPSDEHPLQRRPSSSASSYHSQTQGSPKQSVRGGGLQEMSETAFSEAFFGYIDSHLDALLVMQACQDGLLKRVGRRLTQEERAGIRSGSIFVFDQAESGIKRWTDGMTWSPSRVFNGNFLIYRQTEPRGVSSGTYEDEEPMEGGITAYPQEPAFTASLKGDMVLKPGGMVKKAISAALPGDPTKSLHLISYYAREDVARGRLSRPSATRGLVDKVVITEEMLSQFQPATATGSGPGGVSIRKVKIENDEGLGSSPEEGWRMKAGGSMPSVTVMGTGGGSSPPLGPQRRGSSGGRVTRSNSGRSVGSGSGGVYAGTSSGGSGSRSKQKSTSGSLMVGSVVGEGMLDVSPISISVTPPGDNVGGYVGEVGGVGNGGNVFSGRNRNSGTGSGGAGGFWAFPPTGRGNVDPPEELLKGTDGER